MLLVILKNKRMKLKYSISFIQIYNNVFDKANFDILDTQVEVDGRIIKFKEMTITAWLKSHFFNQELINKRFMTNIEKLWNSFNYEERSLAYQRTMTDSVTLDEDDVEKEFHVRFETIHNE